MIRETIIIEWSHKEMKNKVGSITNKIKFIFTNTFHDAYSDIALIMINIYFNLIERTIFLLH